MGSDNSKSVIPSHPSRSDESITTAKHSSFSGKPEKCNDQNQIVESPTVDPTTPPIVRLKRLDRTSTAAVCAQVQRHIWELNDECFARQSALCDHIRSVDEQNLLVSSQILKSKTALERLIGELKTMDSTLSQLDRMRAELDRTIFQVEALRKLALPQALVEEGLAREELQKSKTSSASSPALNLSDPNIPSTILEQDKQQPALETSSPSTSVNSLTKATPVPTPEPKREGERDTAWLYNASRPVKLSPTPRATTSTFTPNANNNKVQTPSNVPTTPNHVSSMSSPPPLLPQLNICTPLPHFLDYATQSLALFRPTVDDRLGSRDMVGSSLSQPNPLQTPKKHARVAPTPTRVRRTSRANSTEHRPQALQFGTSHVPQSGRSHLHSPQTRPNTSSIEPTKSPISLTNPKHEMSSSTTPNKTKYPNSSQPASSHHALTGPQIQPGKPEKNANNLTSEGPEIAGS